jgi:hypothetical protein
MIGAKIDDQPLAGQWHASDQFDYRIPSVSALIAACVRLLTPSLP